MFKFSSEDICWWYINGPMLFNMLLFHQQETHKILEINSSKDFFAGCSNSTRGLFGGGLLEVLQNLIQLILLLLQQQEMHKILVI